MDNILLISLIVVLLLGTTFFVYKFYINNKVINALRAENVEYLRALEDGSGAIQLAIKYEEFYNSTVGDIGEVVDSLGALINKRQMLSDDPDVQNLVRLVAIAHDTLLAYINAKSPTEENGIIRGKAN